MIIIITIWGWKSAWVGFSAHIAASSNQHCCRAQGDGSPVRGAVAHAGSGFSAYEHRRGACYDGIGRPRAGAKVANGGGGFSAYEHRRGACYDGVGRPRAGAKVANRGSGFPLYGHGRNSGWHHRPAHVGFGAIGKRACVHVAHSGSCWHGYNCLINPHKRPLHHHIPGGV